MNTKNNAPAAYDKVNGISVIYTGKTTAFRPTREEIEALKVGDVAPFCFGDAVVTRVSYRSVDINGRAYVGYYVRWSENSEMSESMKEGEVMRTMSVCRAHTSDEIRAFDLAVSR